MISVTPSSVPLLKIHLNTSFGRDLTIENTGDTVLEISSIIPNQSWIRIYPGWDNFPRQISPHSSIIVPITGECGSTIEIRNGAFVITHNAKNAANPLLVPVSLDCYPNIGVSGNDSVSVKAGTDTDLASAVLGDPLKAGVTWEVISSNAGDSIVPKSSAAYSDGSTLETAVFHANIVGDNRKVTVIATSKTDSTVKGVFTVYVAAIYLGVTDRGLASVFVYSNGTPDFQVGRNSQVGFASIRISNDITDSGATWEISGPATLFDTNIYATSIRAGGVACQNTVIAYLVATSIADPTKKSPPFPVYVSGGACPTSP